MFEFADHGRRLWREMYGDSCVAVAKLSRLSEQLLLSIRSSWRFCSVPLARVAPLSPPPGLFHRCPVSYSSPPISQDQFRRVDWRQYSLIGVGWRHSLVFEGEEQSPPHVTAPRSTQLTKPHELFGQTASHVDRLVGRIYSRGHEVLPQYRWISTLDYGDCTHTLDSSPAHRPSIDYDLTENSRAFLSKTQLPVAPRIDYHGTALRYAKIPLD